MNSSTRTLAWAGMLALLISSAGVWPRSRTATESIEPVLALASSTRIPTPNCKCGHDLKRVLDPSSSWWISGEGCECVRVSVTPGPGGDCEPHCNSVPNCEGSHVGCCPLPGQVVVSIPVWSGCCGGNVTVTINGDSSTIPYLSSNGVWAQVGGDSVACLGSDQEESGGDLVVVDCYQTFHCVWRIKDVCTKCPG